MTKWHIILLRQGIVQRVETYDVDKQFKHELIACHNTLHNGGNRDGFLFDSIQTVREYL